jgi:1,4-alpha-glucan branching enzyme
MPLATTIVKALARGEVRDPFAILGLQAEGGQLFLRAWVRGAEAITAVPRDGTAPIVLKARDDAGLFEALTGRSERFAYDLRVTFPGGVTVTRPDVYAFWPVVPQFDLDLFRSGHHHHLGDVLGAHPMTLDGVAGVGFSVWAPNAVRVSVVGDWNGYDGTAHPMRPRDPYGVWDLFLPGVKAGDLYKYEIRTKEGALRIKADPMAWETEQPPATASRVGAPDAFRWSDGTWMGSRRADDLMAKPLAIYEVHLGSWMRGVEPHAWPNYRVLAQKLIRHCQDLGFNAIELLPVAGHPYEGSWGYQVTGQYAPNPRHGTPDDFRWFVDQCHAAGIAVLVDYVPGHFPKDDFALRRFDGTACYEYEDEREGEHKTWGTHVFNYKRP